MFQFGVTARPNTNNEEQIRQLHLSATKLIKAKEYQKAIRQLREAQILMPIVDTEYPIAQYLRLPLTLQKAGFFQDSLMEFERLLNQENRPYDISHIHDKFRLACQREGDHSDAIEHGVLSLAWECIALDSQNRDWSYIADDPDRWLRPIQKSLKALNKPNASNAISKSCLDFTRFPSSAAAAILARSVRDTLKA